MNDLSIRASALLLFLLTSFIHHLILGSADGFLYYFSAALSDLFVIYALNRIKPAKMCVLYMQVICLAFAAVNFLGWVIWYLYYPPFVYNAICYLLYIIAIMIILKRGGDGRGTSDHRMHPSFYLYRYQSGLGYLKNQGKL